LIHFKNLCKCHNVPPPITTIKGKKDSFSFLLEWVPSRTYTTTYVGEDVGKKEPTYTTGRNVN
jgi:hypothetical protein